MVRATDILRSLVQIRLGGYFSGKLVSILRAHSVTYFSEKGLSVRSGIRTHAHIRGPEYSFNVKGRDFTLESGALDRSAILTYLYQILFHNPIHFINYSFLKEWRTRASIPVLLAC